MKENLSIALTVMFFAHYLFDFYFQSDSIAQRKSKSIPALTIHTIVYSLGMWIVLGFTELYLYDKVDEHIGIALWILIISHFTIDFITSRLNTLFWNREERRKFFLCLGFDQFLHQIVIIIILLVI